MSAADTHAKATTNYLGNLQIQITQLAGKDGISQIRLYDNYLASRFIDISFTIFSDNALLILWTPILDFAHKPQVEFSLESGEIFRKDSHAASKIGDKVMATWIFQHSEVLKMITDNLTSINIINRKPNYKSVFLFKPISPSLYNSENEGKEIFKTLCKTLAQESAKYGIILSQDYKLASASLKTPKAPTNTPLPNTIPQPLSRQYNPNTKYGRKMARNQAAYNYEHGSQEYRNSIDNIGCIVWSGVVVLCLAIFIVISMVSGSDAAIKWLK